MNREQLERWRGLKDLVCDAVTEGTSAIERVHLETARRPFHLLEHVPAVSEPSRGIHRMHDALVSFSYGNVRAVTHAVAKTVDIALDAVETKEPSDEPKASDSDAPAEIP